MDFRKNELPDGSVQCVVTSPPYWGLRKYSGEQDLIWGDSDCKHQWVDSSIPKSGGVGDYEVGRVGNALARTSSHERKESNTCSLCGDWKGAYGLEPNPEMYVQHTIEILREIRRVLRKDGCVFWNIGDSYSGGDRKTNPDKHGGLKCDAHSPTDNVPNRMIGRHPIIKPKDLCLIPFRVAIAAQEDGWWVRSVIIWSKPNPMPESVTDRPTESHEYILMLTKSKNYYWDADAVREKYSDVTINDPRVGKDISRGGIKDYKTAGVQNPSEVRARIFNNLNSGRNIRSVWEFPTQPYPHAHFAVFPEKLPEICIKAATPEVGCCSKCGAPWERITNHSYKVRAIRSPTEKQFESVGGSRPNMPFMGDRISETLGWQPTCKCNAEKTMSIVLDPFSGAGTTLWVAKKLGRKAIGFDTSEEYCQLAVNRNRQQAMRLDL